MRAACLHAHGAFSFQDSLIRAESAAKKAKAVGYVGLSLTDHGNVAGVVEHYKHCKENGLVPLLGSEFYITPDIKVRDSEHRKELTNHITVYAQNSTGVKNLFKLSSLSYLEGYYYKPRIDYPALFENQNGLMVTSGCIKNDVAQMILRGDDFEEVLKRVQLIRHNLGTRYWLELMPHNFPEQVKVNSALYQVHKLEGIPMVVSLDAHYLEPEDHERQDLLINMQMHTDPESLTRPKLKGETYHLMAPEELRYLFLKNNTFMDEKDLDEAIENTAVLADMVVDTEQEPLLPKVVNMFPAYSNNDAENIQMFDQLVRDGWAKKLKEGKISDLALYEKRVKYESDLIKSSGFYNYFLVVWDIVRFAKEKGIPYGVGRGSVGSSVVAWLLGITGVDAIKHNLIFERFISPLRTDYPDIDMDFCHDRRNEILTYIIDRYGKDHVAQIATYSERSVKSAMKDLGRVLKIPFAMMNTITAAIDWDQYKSVEEALQNNKTAQALQNKYKGLFDHVTFFDGSLRQFGKHAAGVVIASKPLNEIVPLMKSRNEDDVIQTVCQFDMETMQDFGLIKMDILGLRTVTIIADMVKRVKELYGADLDLENLPTTDPAIYKMFSKGDVDGIFQFDKSAQLRVLIQNIKPDCFQELHDMTAIYRPGPLSHGMDQTYIKNKYEPRPGAMYHPIQAVHDILKDTYGTLIYQEQIMEIISKAAGLSYSVADTFRKAMAKNKIAAEVKDAAVLKHIHTFRDGCMKNGLTVKQADALWDLVSTYTEYTFNRSHAVEYTTMSYWMAHIKHYYPKAFVLSLFNHAEKDIDDIKRYVMMAVRVDIKPRLPDVNHSDKGFAYSMDGRLLWGLGNIKSVSETVIDEILLKRPFVSLKDMMKKIGSKRILDRRVVRALYKSGALDRFEKEKTLQPDYDDLYGKGEFDQDFPPSLDYLLMEKEALGIYLTRHPLLINKDIKDTIDRAQAWLMSDYDNVAKSSWKWAGVVDDVEIKKSKKNNREFCVITLEDNLYSRVELYMNPTDYEYEKDKIRIGDVIMCTASKSSRGLHFEKSFENLNMKNEPTTNEPEKAHTA